MQRGGQQRGFSMIEVLVAIGVSTIFFTAAALVFQNVTVNRKRLATIESVPIGAASIENFYGITATSEINVYSAPNFGRAAFANEMRERFRDDVARSSAVYCLGRDGLNEIRPDSISYPDGTGLLDTPSDFRALLVSNYGADASVFVDYDGASTAEDASIYLIEPGSSATTLDVVAVYDIDIVPVTSGATLLGNYVSVRRYVDGDLSNYYDIYYEAGSGNSFSPLIVHMSRAGQATYESSADAKKYMAAAEAPFYLMWWPDPAAHHLEASNPPSPAAAATEPLSGYWTMGGRTSFMFTVPMFPGLY